MKKTVKKKTIKFEPPKERELPKFKKRREWVAIFEYRQGARSATEIHQKLGFHADGGIKEAAKEADRIAIMLSKAIGTTLEEIEKRLCRVVAVYAVNAYKDWNKEVGVRSVKGMDKAHIREAISFVKKEFTDKTPVKDKKIGVRA